jgi:hypothetical protein
MKQVYAASIAATRRNGQDYSHTVAVIWDADSKQDAQEKAYQLCLESFPSANWCQHSTSVAAVSEFIVK